MQSRIPAAAAVVLLAAGLTACHGTSTTSGQAKENKQQAQDTASLVNNQPLPHFGWSQFRQTAIDVETIQAQGTATTSFFFNMGVRDPMFVCPSIGLPMPNTAQLSNPQQVVSGSDDRGYGLTTIGQMDPNGTYAPSASTGTAVICVNSAGKPYLKYWEGFVDSVTAPARWDAATGQEVITGAPTYTIRTGK